MYWLFNTKTNRRLAPCGHIPATAMNKFVREFPWIIVIKVAES